MSNSHLSPFRRLTAWLTLVTFVCTTLAPVHGALSRTERTFIFSKAHPLRSDATGWELTSKDGRKFSFDATGRLEQMRDPQGNVLAIVRDGAGRIQKVTHSSGKEITFVRNADGFITEAIDPAGNRCRYSYDAAGDLRAFYDRVTDPATQAGTQQFSYTAGTHYLTDLFDGKGVRAAKNYYDNDGRLQRTVDAQGQETVFTHNLAGRTETIKDRAGNTTTYRYDTRGNVTDTTLPDGTRMQTDPLTPRRPSPF